MIEIELPFDIDENFKSFLKNFCTYLSNSVIHDTYYDTKEFFLTTHGIWLRKRNESYQIKALVKTSHENGSLHKEYEDENEILHFLSDLFSISHEQIDLEKLISKLNLISFCSLNTIRKNYQFNEFNIAYDTVSANDWSLELGEIEILVNEETLSKKALMKIEQLANKHSLKRSNASFGKVLQYLKDLHPKHFEVLIKAYTENAS